MQNVMAKYFGTTKQQTQHTQTKVETIEKVHRPPEKAFPEESQETAAALTEEVDD